MEPGGGRPTSGIHLEGELVWDYSFGDSKRRPHHEICRLPNGNVLVVVSDPKTVEEAIAAGRNPKSVRNRLVSDGILELKPTGKTTAEIAWAWYAWDHLIQEFDKSKPNFGDVSEHPERIDLNFSAGHMDRMTNDPQQLARLRALGYVGGGKQKPASESTEPATGKPDDKAKVEKSKGEKAKGDKAAEDEDDDAPAPARSMGGDWTHVNSVAYNAKLDQIMISVHEFSEVWIIDHGATTAEAASHKGGRRGKGGDLLYRWGNPRVYRSGSNVDQRLFVQHCAHWIPDGLPGAGHMLVFNNGTGRPDGDYSSIEEVVLPLNAKGLYDREEFVAFGPEQATWTYTAPEKPLFLSPLISSTQRLPNGNSFICSGIQRTLFEVTPNNEIVWQFKYTATGIGPRIVPNILVPGFFHRMLAITDDQRFAILQLQREVDNKLFWLLSDNQWKVLVEPPAPPVVGFEGGEQGSSPAGEPRKIPAASRPRRVGEVIPSSVIEDLALSESQMNELMLMQQHVDEEFDKIWRDDQQELLERMSPRSQRVSISGSPGGSEPSRKASPVVGTTSATGTSDGSPSQPPAGSRRAPPRHAGGMGGLFRSYRYGSDFPGLAGRELKPGRLLIDK